MGQLPGTVVSIGLLPSAHGSGRWHSSVGSIIGVGQLHLQTVAASDVELTTAIGAPYAQMSGQLHLTGGHVHVEHLFSTWFSTAGPPTGQVAFTFGQSTHL